MFGWLKLWGRAQREREDHEIELAMARTVGMARVIDDRRLRLRRAQELVRAKDAARAPRLESTGGGSSD